MEQVAEALKKLMENGQWKPDVDGNDINDRIIEWIHEEYAARIQVVELMAILESIISIYKKKANAIEWHIRTDDCEFEPNELYEWEHDITGEVFRSSSIVEGLYPEHANKWADGTYGGYCFESNGVEFKTIDGVRGIGYKAVIAFDRNGKGIAFF